MVHEQPIPREERGLEAVVSMHAESIQSRRLYWGLGDLMLSPITKEHASNADATRVGWTRELWHVGGVLGDAIRRYFVGPSHQVGSSGLLTCYRGKFPTIRLLECWALQNNTPNGLCGSSPR